MRLRLKRKGYSEEVAAKNSDYQNNKICQEPISDHASIMSNRNGKYYQLITSQNKTFFLPDTERSLF